MLSQATKLVTVSFFAIEQVGMRKTHHYAGLTWCFLLEEHVTNTGAL